MRPLPAVFPSFALELSNVKVRMARASATAAKRGIPLRQGTSIAAIPPLPLGCRSLSSEVQRIQDFFCCDMQEIVAPRVKSSQGVDKPK